MYRLNIILDYPDPNTHTFSDAFRKGKGFSFLCLFTSLCASFLEFIWFNTVASHSL